LTAQEGRGKGRGISPVEPTPDVHRTKKSKLFVEISSPRFQRKGKKKRILHYHLLKEEEEGLRGKEDLPKKGGGRGKFRGPT